MICRIFVTGARRYSRDQMVKKHHWLKVSDAWGGVTQSNTVVDQYYGYYIDDVPFLDVIR